MLVQTTARLLPLGPPICSVLAPTAGIKETSDLSTKSLDEHHWITHSSLWSESALEKRVPCARVLSSRGLIRIGQARADSGCRGPLSKLQKRELLIAGRSRRDIPAAICAANGLRSCTFATSVTMCSMGSLQLTYPHPGHQDLRRRNDVRKPRKASG